MNSTLRILILGGTGSISYAVTNNLVAKGCCVTLLVRDVAKAQRLFAPAPNLILEQGDAQDRARLLAVSRGHSVIFHGINYPYHQWSGNMERVTANVIEAASQEQATIVFPGNVCNYGLTTPIREDSRPQPVSKKGALRVQLEQMLADAAHAGRCRVLNVRLPDFWGPDVLNFGITPVFEGALTGKALPYLLNADIPHQMAYTPDAAEVISRLLLAGPQQPYEVVNYGGQVMPSVRRFFGQISAVAGQPLRIRVQPRWLFSLLGLFMPMVREAKEMLYLFENSIILDDTMLRCRFPEWQETPLSEALATTLSWFAEHQLHRSFTPAGAAAPTERHPVSVPSNA
ncbi:NAD-dependent epimerase/dehydratase family protein [Hymenobacter elongatus]|uniref:NAD-dependent epimerase/dehydratase family protein n=1 Tax=Hymenobacter elongatus TaxID=877208 RepID=A0A4Z0PMH1_9BACT|nr:NAD-dependent epimerase/dehydratase family protein [Hymenobacter elongatus]TGE17144.1 NAD-dependent epimerase/dehydratase family protein [Hymenobacter elongatus]